MSYQLKINKRSLKAARFISRLQSVIQRSFVESGLTQQEVAERLGVDRSVINRRLKGKANLTARSIADFAFVLDKDIVFDLVDTDQKTSFNWTRSEADGNSFIKRQKLTSKANASVTLGEKKPSFERVEA